VIVNFFRSCRWSNERGFGWLVLPSDIAGWFQFPGVAFIRGLLLLPRMECSNFLLKPNNRLVVLLQFMLELQIFLIQSFASRSQLPQKRRFLGWRGALICHSIACWSSNTKRSKTSRNNFEVILGSLESRDWEIYSKDWFDFVFLLLVIIWLTTLLFILVVLTENMATPNSERASLVSQDKNLKKIVRHWKISARLEGWDKDRDKANWKCPQTRVHSTSSLVVLVVVLLLRSRYFPSRPN